MAGTLNVKDSLTDNNIAISVDPTLNAVGVQGVTGGVSLATQDYYEAKAFTGQAFLAGTAALTLAGAGNVRATFSNPNASGKTCYVRSLSGGANAVATAHLFVNPTTGTPATAARPNSNLYFGSATVAVGVLKADTNLVTALSGGTDSGVDLYVGANVRTSFTDDINPIIIPAGVTLGINIAFTGSATATLNIVWYEA